MTEGDKLYKKFHEETTDQTAFINNDNFTYRLLLKVLEKHIKPSDSILDIGCGTGTLGLYFANKGNKVLGVDISPKAIDAANQSAKNLGLKNAKFQVVNFPDKVPNGKFDFIIFTEVIEHLKDDDKALKQIYKLLNKNGKVLISTPSKNAPLHKTGYAKDFDKRVGHVRRYCMMDLSKMCEDNGLKIVESRKIEGVIRNFLFLSPTAGKLVRFVKYFVADVVTVVDNLTVPIFGESNIIVVAKKE